MAKAPRRRGRSGKDGEKPPAARPVRPQSTGNPPSAKPIKSGSATPPVARPVKPATPPVARPVKPAAPPVARPVKPAAPPVARPVKPAAPPVARPVKPAAQPPVAKPVARAQPAVQQPVAKEGRAASSSRGGARMAEEDLGRSRGRASSRGGGYGGGGMGLAAKVGLLAALAAFVAIGAAVVLAGGSGGDEQEEDQFNAYGMAAVSALSAPDAKWWRGAGGPTARNLSYFEKKFADLLGPAGAEFWKSRLEALTQPVPREEEGTFTGEKLKEDQERFQRALKKLDRGKGGGPSNVVQARLSQVWNRMGASERSRYQIVAGWVRDDGGASEGKWLAGNVRPNEVRADWTQHASLGGRFGSMEGVVTGSPVRIFTANITGSKGAPGMLGYVAVFDGGSSGGGGAVALIMLILGPLLVGGIAYAVANSHTKNVRKLAREIDRLGSAGDPTRELHAHGAEATALARSVERMASNLEFRSKHEGADLDEVVSREQQVAEEIHGSLTRKNPPRLSNYEVETLFKPGFEIGGDHFEYFKIDEDHLGIILLDTNVRGIPAALVMASARSYVRAEAPGVLSPAELLKRVNRHLSGDLPAGRHVTALYVVLNTADGSATLASAGHLPLLVYRHQAGKMAKVNPDGIAMGLDAGPVFEEALQEGDIPIGVGDRIVLYTDGALKVQNSEGEEFGEQSFYAAVTAEAPKNSQAFVNFVGGAIDRFHLEVPQNDDITISTIKRLR